MYLKFETAHASLERMHFNRFARAHALLKMLQISVAGCCSLEQPPNTAQFLSRGIEVKQAEHLKGLS